MCMHILLYFCLPLHHCLNQPLSDLNDSYPQGSYLFTTYRPVEQLRQLLLLSQGFDSDAVQSFFKLHKVREENMKLN